MGKVTLRKGMKVRIRMDADTVAEDFGYYWGNVERRTHHLDKGEVFVIDEVVSEDGETVRHVTDESHRWWYHPSQLDVCSSVPQQVPSVSEDPVYE